MVLKLGVDLLYFPLCFFHQPFFFCFRQDCGFHPVRLLHLQQNHEQLQCRTGVSLLENKVKEKGISLHPKRAGTFSILLRTSNRCCLIFFCSCNVEISLSIREGKLIH